jgi:serine protease AprX
MSWLSRDGLATATPRLAGTASPEQRRRRWIRVAIAGLLLATAGGVLGARPAVAACGSSSSQAHVVVEATDAATAAAAVAAVGGGVDRSLDVVRAVSAWVPTSVLGALAAQPGVEYVSPSSPVKLQADATPPRDATAVYPQVIGAPALWRQGTDGRHATVAVIDTGISPVPDVAGRLVGGIDLTGGNDPFRDDYGHGTFVAGLIAGNGASSGGAYKGIAPNARLVSIKIAGADGSADITQVLAAIQWAVSFRNKFGIKVINLSLGTDSQQSYQHSLLNYAVERAWDAGIVVVVSASNLGPNPGTVTKPGDDPLVVTAGAVDDAGTVARADDTVPGFSGVGPTVDGLHKPDLVAPGRSVISLRAPGSTVDTQFPTARIGDAYFKGSGTSFSTAITSGAAALLLDGKPSLTPDQVKSRLLAGVAPAPVDDPDIAGRGSLDVAAASATSAPDVSQASVPRSMGDGTLADSRGHLLVGLTPSPAASGSCASVSPGWLHGEVTGQNQPFDRAGYRGDWNGSSWYGSSWYGSSWYGSSWYGSSWYGSSWYGSSWYGSSWYGSSWYGSSWYGSSWYGSSWYGSSWYAVAWS